MILSDSDTTHFTEPSQINKTTHTYSEPSVNVSGLIVGERWREPPEAERERAFTLRRTERPHRFKAAPLKNTHLHHLSLLR